MKNQEIINQFLSAYTFLIKDTFVSYVCDFPNPIEFSSSKEWKNVFELTKNNQQEIINKVKEYDLSKIIKLENSVYINDKLFEEIKLLTLLWMIIFLNEIYKIGLSQNEIEIDSYDDWELKIFSPNINNKNIYYRGVSNKDYDLIPSLYRNFDEDFKLDYSNSNKDLIGKYDDFTSVFKYEDDSYIRGKRNKFKVARESNARYEYFFRYLSYMQHSELPTQLLDITESPIIATSFACHKAYKNSAIYVMKLGKENRIRKNDLNESFFTDFYVEYKNEGIKPDTKLFDKNLWQLDLNSLTANFKVFNAFDNYPFCFNDRMKYQKGCFLIPTRAVIIKSKVLVDYKKSHIEKYVFDKKVKKEIKENIYGTYPYFKYTYLMNPFRYFEDD